MKHALLFAVLLVVFPACTMPKRNVTNLGELQANQIVLVGRLTIDKKLPESSHVVDVMDIVESGLIRASNAPLPFTETRPSSFEPNDILVKWGDTFGVPFEKVPAIFVSGIYAFSFNGQGRTTYAFPVMGSIHPKAGARYVYIGHISLHLDDFYSLKSVKVIDEFEKSAAALARYKGIKKSLFVPE